MGDRPANKTHGHERNAHLTIRRPSNASPTFLLRKSVSSDGCINPFEVWMNFQLTHSLRRHSMVPQESHFELVYVYCRFRFVDRNTSVQQFPCASQGLQTQRSDRTAISEDSSFSRCTSLDLSNAYVCISSKIDFLNPVKHKVLQTGHVCRRTVYVVTLWEIRHLLSKTCGKPMTLGINY